MAPPESSKKGGWGERVPLAQQCALCRSRCVTSGSSHQGENALRDVHRQVAHDPALAQSVLSSDDAVDALRSAFYLGTKQDLVHAPNDAIRLRVTA